VKDVSDILAAIGNSDTEPELVQVVSTYLNQIGYKIKSYQELEYYQTVVSYLYRNCVNKPAFNSRQKLLSTLVYLNFNTQDFIEIFVQPYHPRLDEEWDYAVSKNQAEEQLLSIRVLQEHGEVAYDHWMRSVKTAAEEVVIKKIEFNRMRQMRLESEYRELEKAGFIVMNFNLKETLGWNLLQERGQITHFKQKAHMYEFLHKNVRLAKGVQISKDSIQNKYPKALDDLRVRKTLRQRVRVLLDILGPDDEDSDLPSS